MSKAAPQTEPDPSKPLLIYRPAPGRANKLRRALWNIICFVLFRPSPTPLHGWRRFLLRCFGAHVEERVGIYPGVSIWAPWNLTLRRGATVGGGATLYNVDQIEIGEYAIVSQGAHLCTASHDHNAAGFDLVTAPIRLGPHAWVATGAFVGPGVVIGTGAVLGARAVLVRSLGERNVAVGNPARVIARRHIAAQNQLAGRVDEPLGQVKLPTP